MALTNEQKKLFDACPVLAANNQKLFDACPILNKNSTKDFNACPILDGLTEIPFDDEESEPEFTPVTYNLVSYADAEGETEYDTGTVETTGIESNGYTQVEVKTNLEHESFVGNKYYIISTAKTDGTIYRLYNNAGSDPVDIYVSITAST